MAEPELPRHLRQTAVLLDDARLLYVPVPKAGSTGVLWALSRLAGLPEEAFRASSKLEVTRAQTIHDMSAWGDRHRADHRSENELREIFRSDDWLTLTVVRDPVRRIWSGWVSKILVRDPRFVAPYGDEAWFPPIPGSAEDVVTAFRRFLELAPATDAWGNVHWCPQLDLVGSDRLRYRVLGRVEEPEGWLGAVQPHLRARGLDRLEPRRENVSLLAWTPEILDEAAHARCESATARDRAAYGYELPPRTDGKPDERWASEVTARLPAIRAVIERNERIGDLRSLVMRTRSP